VLKLDNRNTICLKARLVLKVAQDVIQLASLCALSQLKQFVDITKYDWQVVIAFGQAVRDQTRAPEPSLLFTKS